MSQATLAPDYATLTELETLMRNGKSALAQEGGAAGREALRCFGALAERCQQSLVISCMQMSPDGTCLATGAFDATICLWGPGKS